MFNLQGRKSKGAAGGKPTENPGSGAMPNGERSRIVVLVAAAMAAGRGGSERFSGGRQGQGTTSTMQGAV